MLNKLFNYEFSLFNIEISGSRIIRHPFFAGSAIMIVGSNLANIFAYLFHLVLGRMLGPSAYGELAATLATLGMFSSTFSFLGLVVVKFVAAAKGKEKNNLYSWFFSNSMKLGILAGIILLILTPFLADFLHLPIKITILIGPILYLFLFSFLQRSFLQGLLEFSNVVIVTNLDIISRLVIGALLVWIGLSSFGAVFGVFIAAIFSYILGAYYLKEFKGYASPKKFSGAAKIIKYAIPVFVVSIANNSFISTDVILVKHFFNAHDAGIYASLSVLSKIIFYGTGPVSAVMFPLVSKKFADKQDYYKLFMLSLMLTTFISLSVLVIFYFFPAIMIKILFGSKFLEASSNLFIFGVFITIYTIANLFISLALSIEKTTVVYLPIFFAVLQAMGIYFLHNSIYQVMQVSVFSSTLLLISLLIYFAYDRKIE